MSAILVEGSGDSSDLMTPAFSLWAIYSAGTSDPVIEPDTFVGIDFVGEARVSDYPVEQGAFADYNKVQTPRGIRVKLACANEQMQRGDFLDQLEAMKKAAELYDISTPDLLYEGFTLAHYDYARKATNGVSMIQVECHFEEIRQTGSATFSSDSPSSTISSNSPSANDPVNSGTVAATTPTAAQAASATNAGAPM